MICKKEKAFDTLETLYVVFEWLLAIQTFIIMSLIKHIIEKNKDCE
jgi:hypothetical protein